VEEQVTEPATDPGTVPDPDPVTDEPVAEQAEPVAESEPDPAPEPVTEANSMPPTNRPTPEREDEGRLSATEAIAPSRRPGMGRPPGAHIGDEDDRRAKIILFANQKGGVAKTTTTLNLAVAFTDSVHKVLAVDLDPQGNL